MNDNNSIQTNDYYKNLNKRGNCSKCNIVLTRDNYKKGRTVCKFCYNNNVLRYYKNKFSYNLSSKTDVSTQTDFSDELDDSNKKITSKKRNTSTKKARSTKKDDLIIHDNSNIEDITINNIFDNDPDLLCDKLREILSKSDMSENDYIMTKMIIDELYRVKCITRKEYKAMKEKLGLV